MLPCPFVFSPSPIRSTNDCANFRPMGEGRGEGPPGLAQKNVLVLANRATPRPTTPYVDTYGAVREPPCGTGTLSFQQIDRLNHLIFQETFK